MPKKAFENFLFDKSNLKFFSIMLGNILMGGYFCVTNDFTAFLTIRIRKSLSDK